MGKVKVRIEKQNICDIIYIIYERKMNMKKEKKQQEQVKKVKKYDKGQIFVKVMAGILALLMILAAASTLIYSLMI